MITVTVCVEDISSGKIGSNKSLDYKLPKKLLDVDVIENKTSKAYQVFRDISYIYFLNQLNNSRFKSLESLYKLEIKEKQTYLF